MSIEFNPETGCIEIKETMSFTHHILPVIHQVREELEDWYSDEVESHSEEDINPNLNQDLENCNNFLIDSKDDSCWDERKIAVICEYIIDKYDRECNYPVYEPSIFDEEIIRCGIESFIEEEWEFDPRF